MRRYSPFFLHFLYSFLTVDFFGYHFRLYSLSAVNFDDKVVVPCMLLLYMVLQLLSFHASCRENQHSKHQIITLKSKQKKPEKIDKNETFILHHRRVNHIVAKRKCRWWWSHANIIFMAWK